jgi:hypothetical protein
MDKVRYFNDRRLLEGRNKAEAPNSLAAVWVLVTFAVVVSPKLTLVPVHVALVGLVGDLSHLVLVKDI